MVEFIGKEPYEVARAIKFNESITANTNIFSSFVTFDYTGIARIYACFDTAGVLTVVRKRNNTTVTEQLNSGSNLVANAAYIFDIVVDDGEAINLRYSVNATVVKLGIYEVPSE